MSGDKIKLLSAKDANNLTVALSLHEPSKSILETMMQHINVAARGGWVYCIDVSNEYILHVGSHNWLLVINALEFLGYKIIESDKFIDSAGMSDGVKISWAEK